MLAKDRVASPQNTAQILKALLLGDTIETEHGVFKYFHKGDWIELDADTEGEVAQEGIFKRCEVIHHSTKMTHSVDTAVTTYRWLLWLSSLADFVAWTETITPQEMVKVNAHLALNKGKERSEYDRPLSELMEEIEL